MGKVSYNHRQRGGKSETECARERERESARDLNISGNWEVKIDWLEGRGSEV